MEFNDKELEILKEFVIAGFGDLLNGNFNSLDINEENVFKKLGLI